MSGQVTFDVIGDGTTDRVLTPIITWAIHRLDPSAEVLEPEFRKRHGSISDFFASYETGAMLIFAHRDAESDTYQQRLSEFANIADSRVVPVIPVRMSEAWLLIDPMAIATAAGRPQATVQMPSTSELESILDPKEHLHKLLYSAAGSPTGRRKKVFHRRLTSTRVLVADRIDDFSALEHLSSFREFQEALAKAYPYGPS